MGRRESPLEARACRWARARGIVTAKLTLCNGVPDRIFFLPGSPLIIEFKGRGIEPIPGSIQEWHLKALRKAGYKAVWCDTWDKFEELVEGKWTT